MRFLATLFRGLAAADQTDLAERATDVHASAAILEALQMSHGDLANLLRTALRAEYQGDRTYVWTRDVYDDSVVYEVSTDDQTRLFQRTYSVQDGAVTLGEPMAVIAVTQYVKADQAAITVPATPVTQVSAPAQESAEVMGDLVPLVEKAVAQDGTARIKIISPGQGSSGYYPADVLKRDAGVFAEGTHIYLDHPTATAEREQPERSVRDLAGSLTGTATWEEHGSDGPGIYAPVKFIDSVAPHINAIASISGMSIRASGKAGTREIDGKKIRTIESLDAAHSVDVVTRAGRGGKVLDLIESARSRQQGGGTPPPEGWTVDKETATKLQADLDEANKTIKELVSDIERFREQRILDDARTIVSRQLANAKLPALTQNRLTETLVNGATAKDGALDRDALTAAIEAAVKDAAAELAEANGGNPVRGMGGGTPPNEADAHASLVESFIARGYSKETAERMAAL